MPDSMFRVPQIGAKRLVIRSAGEDIKVISTQRYYW
jgi:hypothetical protein